MLKKIPQRGAESSETWSLEVAVFCEAKPVSHKLPLMYSI